MASRVDDVHHFLVPRKFEWIEEIDDEIEYVQGKPGDGEGESNCHQKPVSSAQALMKKVMQKDFVLIFY